jgi:sugar phosphate isomerase/epimerase
MSPSPLGRDALVLCAGTVPRASFRDRVAAARAAEFGGISLRVGDCRRACEELGDRGVRAMLADAGLAVAEVEALTAWRDRTALGAADEMLALAAAVGARSVSLVDGPGAPPALEAAAAAFAALCDRAAEHGLLVHVEFWPGSALDLATAAAVVQAAGRPNGGLLVDTWHLARTPDGDDLLGTVPGDRLLAVQLSDSPRVAGPEPEYLRATMQDRLLPGEGALDLVGVALRAVVRAARASQ